jgi:hypothetical protein
VPHNRTKHRGKAGFEYCHAASQEILYEIDENTGEGSYTDYKNLMIITEEPLEPKLGAFKAEVSLCTNTLLATRGTIY